MRRKDEEGVSPVIATILMVAITVVLAAVLYVMVVSIIDVDNQKKPIVSMSALECTATACDAQITGASSAIDLAQFRVTVFADGNRMIPVTNLAADTDISGGGLTFRYTDVGGENDLTGGDTFRLSGIASGVEYEVVLLWTDGTAIESVVLSL
jgi:flagellin-like protein